MSQPVPEGCGVQQHPDEAKIFANFSLPYVGIISQLCITVVREDALGGCVFVYFPFWNAHICI